MAFDRHNTPFNKNLYYGGNSRTTLPRKCSEKQVPRINPWLRSSPRDGNIVANPSVG